jgi:hypothetical protein
VILIPSPEAILKRTSETQTPKKKAALLAKRGLIKNAELDQLGTLPSTPLT